MCKTHLAGGRAAGSLRYLLKESKTGGDTDTTMSVLLEVSVNTFGNIHDQTSCLWCLQADSTVQSGQLSFLERYSFLR